MNITARDSTLDDLQNIETKFTGLISKLDYIGTSHLNLLRDSFSFAEYHHRGQMRHDGSNYLSHPVESAEIMVNYFLDKVSSVKSPFSYSDNPETNIATAVSATILHDTIEDTLAEHDDIADNFGLPVAFLVYGMTKPKKNGNPVERDEEYKSIFKTVSIVDPKLIPIRLSDVIHNSKTLNVHREEKKLRIARHMQENYLDTAYASSPEAAKVLEYNTTFYLRAA